ncbi:hypothetical protein MRY82_07295 [bacterium]|nr:hypothetical protein [bacterium]
MFKKLVLSLILAGSTLSMAQSLLEAKRALYETIKSKHTAEQDLWSVLNNALLELSHEEYFIYDEEDEVFISKIYYSPQRLTSSQKDEIRRLYSNVEKAITLTLSSKEKSLIRSYLDSSESNRSNYYNDQIILDYIKENLYKDYFVILKDMYNNDLDNRKPEHSLSVNYGTTIDPKKKRSLIELFYALNLSSFLTSVPGCTKYLEDGDESPEYSAYLTNVGYQTRIIPFDFLAANDLYSKSYAYEYEASLSRVFNFNFVEQSEQMKTLLGDKDERTGKYSNCPRIQNFLAENGYLEN